MKTSSNKPSREKVQKAFMLAVSAGNGEYVESLIQQHGADIEARDINGNTPLMIAIDTYPGGAEVGAIQVLLSYRADVNAVNNEGETPLAFAVRGGHANIVQALLRNGATVDYNYNRNPLILALRVENNHHVAETLIRHGVDRDLSLIHTVIAGDHEIINQLLRLGANFNNAFLHAVILNNEPALRAISQTRRVDINFRDINDNTPLMYAIAHYDASKGAGAIEALLLYGANANTMNNSRETPLSLSIKSGHPEVVRILLRNGANVNYNYEDNPLILALNSEDYYPIAAELIQHGVDRDLTLMYAVTSNERKIIGRLLELKANFDAALFYAIVWRNVAAAEIILQIGGVNINTVYKNYGPPLSIAIRGRDWDMVRMLLSNGADLSLSCELSPLFTAALRKETYYFLDQFFDPSIRAEKKAQAIEVAEAIHLVRLNYFKEDYGTWEGLTSPILVKYLSEMSFPAEFEEEGRCLVEAGKIIDGSREFIRTSNIDGTEVAQKFRVTKVPYKGHAAYFVIEYRNNFPTKLIYVDGHCLFSQKGGRSYGATIFEINPNKLTIYNSSSPELFEEYIQSVFSEKNFIHPSDNLNRLLNFLPRVTDYTPTIVVPEANQLVPTSIQARGNCVMKSWKILARVVAELLHPEIMVFDGSNNAAQKAYKFYTQSLIDRSLEVLTSFVEREQEIREQMLLQDQEQFLAYQKPLFLPEAINTLEKALGKFSQKASKKDEEKDYEGGELQLERGKKVFLALDKELGLNNREAKRRDEIKRAPSLHPYQSVVDQSIIGREVKSPHK